MRAQTPRVSLNLVFVCVRVCVCMYCRAQKRRKKERERERENGRAPMRVGESGVGEGGWGEGREGTGVGRGVHGGSTSTEDLHSGQNRPTLSRCIASALVSKRCPHGNAVTQPQRWSAASGSSVMAHRSPSSSCWSARAGCAAASVPRSQWSASWGPPPSTPLGCTAPSAGQRSPRPPALPSWPSWSATSRHGAGADDDHCGGRSAGHGRGSYRCASHHMPASRAYMGAW